jgi:hypothetical protein
MGKDCDCLTGQGVKLSASRTEAREGRYLLAGKGCYVYKPDCGSKVAVKAGFIYWPDWLLQINRRSKQAICYMAGNYFFSEKGRI